MAAFRTWWQAARPLAQVNIALPLAVGEALAWAHTGELSLGLLVLVHLMGVADQLFIVFANDVADEAGDRLNTRPTPFSGGSRVLPEGKLVPAQLRRAATSMVVVLLALAVAAAVAYRRPLVPVGWALGVGMLWAYSYPPLRLSYRGHGELAQGLGVGIVLPALGFYAQTGSLSAFPVLAFAPLFLLGVASNIATGLPDHEADEAVDKQSWSVRYGPARARKHCLQFLAIGVLLTPWVLPGAPHWAWAVVEAGPAVALLVAWRPRPGREPGSDSSPTRFVFLAGLAGNLALLGWIGWLAIAGETGGRIQPAL